MTFEQFVSALENSKVHYGELMVKERTVLMGGTRNTFALNFNLRNPEIRFSRQVTDPLLVFESTTHVFYLQCRGSGQVFQFGDCTELTDENSSAHESQDRWNALLGE